MHVYNQGSSLNQQNFLRVLREWQETSLQDQLEKVAREGMHVLMHEFPFEEFSEVTRNIENARDLSWFAEYNNMKNVVTVEVPSDLHEVAIKALDDAVLMSLRAQGFGYGNAMPLKLAGSTTFNMHSASIVAASCLCGPAQPQSCFFDSFS